MWHKACWVVLTAGLGVTVDRVHPQVGRAGVKQHLEGLGGCSNADGSIVGGLGNTLVGGKEIERDTNPSDSYCFHQNVSTVCKRISYISVVVDVHAGRGELIGLVFESWILVRQLDALLSQGLTHRLVLRQRDPEEGESKNIKNFDFTWH